MVVTRYMKFPSTGMLRACIMLRSNCISVKNKVQSFLYAKQLPTCSRCMLPKITTLRRTPTWFASCNCRIKRLRYIPKRFGTRCVDATDYTMILSSKRSLMKDYWNSFGTVFWRAGVGIWTIQPVNGCNRIRCQCNYKLVQKILIISGIMKRRKQCGTSWHRGAKTFT